MGIAEFLGKRFGLTDRRGAKGRQKEEGRAPDGIPDPNFMDEPTLARQAGASDSLCPNKPFPVGLPHGAAAASATWAP